MKMCEFTFEECGVCDLCIRNFKQRHDHRKTKKRHYTKKARLRHRLRREAQKKRPQIMIRYGTDCYLCGSPNAGTIDHVRPISAGGRSGIENLRPCCYTCNAAKGDKIYEIV